MKTFDEYKSEVSIIQVAEYLGYKLNKSKGLKTPTYQLFDKNEKKLDEIVINNPNNNSNQYYFDRNRNGGDVVAFIKNHLDDFSSFQHQNSFVRINMILGHFSNTPYEAAQEIKNVKKDKPFDIERYNIKASSINDLKYLYEDRKINKQTLEEFTPFIVKASDKESKYNYSNIAFPYSIPGQKEVTNLEIRNYNFKGMGVNGDKRNSVWIATKAVKPSDVKNVFFAESAIDAISYYQLNKNKISLEDSAFVSVGGYVSKNQIKNTLSYFNKANTHTLFDNDKNGNLYDVMTYFIANKQDYELKINKENQNYDFKVGEKNHFSIPENQLSVTNIKEHFLNLGKDVQVHKPKFSNDWNDLVKGNLNNSVYVSITEKDSILIGGTVKEMAGKTIENKDYQYLFDEGTRNTIKAYIDSNPNLKAIPLTAKDNLLLSDKWAKEISAQTEMSKGCSLNEIDEHSASYYRNYELALKKENKLTTNSYDVLLQNTDDKVKFDNVLNAIVSGDKYKDKSFNVTIERAEGKKDFSISHKDYDSVRKIKNEIDNKMSLSEKKNNSYRFKL